MKALSGWRFGAFELDETNRRLLRKAVGVWRDAEVEDD